LPPLIIIFASRRHAGTNFNNYERRKSEQKLFR